jgi:hypothetical protein
MTNAEWNLGASGPGGSVLAITPIGHWALIGHWELKIGHFPSCTFTA